MAARQAKEIARLQTVVDRFGAKATKAAMAHSMEKRIARLEAERVDAPRGDKVLRVRFPEPPAPGRTVVDGDGLAKGYGGPPVFEDVAFDLGRGERLLVLGLNGAGKTSLLRILAGETEADLGDVAFGHHVTVGYYAQEHDNLRVDETLLDNIRARGADRACMLTETELRGLLGMFGLSGREGVPGGRHAVGRREDQARAGDADGRAQQPAAARRADEQPRPGSRQAVADALGRLAGRDHLRQPRHRVRRAARADQGAADARRRPRLLQRRLARPRRRWPDASSAVDATVRAACASGSFGRASDQRRHDRRRRRRGQAGRGGRVRLVLGAADLRPRRADGARRRRPGGAADRARHERRADVSRGTR